MTDLVRSFFIGMAGGAVTGAIRERRRRRTTPPMPLGAGEMYPAISRAQFEEWLNQHDDELLQEFSDAITAELGEQMPIREAEISAQVRDEVSADVNAWLAERDAEMVAQFNAWLERRDEAGETGTRFTLGGATSDQP